MTLPSKPTRNARVRVEIDLHLPDAEWDETTPLVHPTEASGEALADLIHAVFERGDPDDTLNATVVVDTFDVKRLA